MRVFRKLLAIGLCCAAVLSLTAPAWAQVGAPDTGRKTGLVVHYHQGNLDFDNVGFKIYKIADMVPSGRFVLTDEFADYPIDLRGTMTGAEWADLAGVLSGYAARDSLIPEHEGVTDGKGLYGAGGMGAGLYLITGGTHQREWLDGGVLHRAYYQAAPFLVATPSLVKGEWLYDITVSPKFTMTEQETTSVRVLKAWDDEGYESERPASVKFDLTRDGEVYDTVELTAAGSWRHQWDDLDNAYDWQVVEHLTDGYKVTATWEGITYLVTNRHEDVDPGGDPDTEFPTPPIDIDDPDVPLSPGDPVESDPPAGQSPDPGTSTPPASDPPAGPSNTPTLPGNNNNTGTPSGTQDLPKDEPKLPQTGQLWWPVPVMAGGGCCLFLIGWLIRRDRKRDGHGV